MAVCTRCGFDHVPDELFVRTGTDESGRPILDETCELVDAWLAAHAAPQPHGAVAFHATKNVEAVLATGLNPQLSRLQCQHVCLAETPEIASGLDVGAAVLRVDVSGLDLFFELGEARHHGSMIGPERLELVEPSPRGDSSAWSDPAFRRNHTDCLAAMGLPLSRKLLRRAAAEAAKRWESYSLDQYKALVNELAG